MARRISYSHTEGKLRPTLKKSGLLPLQAADLRTVPLNSGHDSSRILPRGLKLMDILSRRHLCIPAIRVAVMFIVLSAAESANVRLLARISGRRMTQIGRAVRGHRPLCGPNFMQKSRANWMRTIP
jgi:hypothetical protein